MSRLPVILSTKKNKPVCSVHKTDEHVREDTTGWVCALCFQEHAHRPLPNRRSRRRRL